MKRQFYIMRQQEKKPIFIGRASQNFLSTPSNRVLGTFEISLKRCFNKATVSRIFNILFLPEPDCSKGDKKTYKYRRGQAVINLEMAINVAIHNDAIHIPNLFIDTCVIG